MKKNMKILVIILSLFLSGILFPMQIMAQQTYVSYQVFYDQLSPYGQWITYPNYGYVWIPDAGYDFTPYSTNGQWVFTEYGWTWISGYDWGWAPFHYGRWDYSNDFGWFWIPDNEWGPSWVIWRRTNGFYGWAPMRPGISINLSFNDNYNSNNDHWIFVRDRDLERSNIHRYQVSQNDHDRIIINSVVITKTYDDKSRNTKYISGPDRDDFQKVTGKRIKPMVIQDNNVPGQRMNKGQLRIYRPQVNNHSEREQKAAPSRVSNVNDVKRPSERNTNSQHQNINPSENNNRKQQPNTVNPPSRKSNEQPAKVNSPVKKSTDQPNRVKQSRKKSQEQPKTEENRQPKPEKNKRRNK